MKEVKARKVRHQGFHTRSKAEKLLSAGVDPTATFTDDKGATRGRFTEHPNVHVRQKAFRRMGSPFPEDATERAKLCASLRIKDPALVIKEEAVDQLDSVSV